MVKYYDMESEDTVFYLGKREESDPEEEKASEKNFRIAYGGDIPFELEKSNDKWGSPENMERVRVLSEKCERRSRVVGRLIYLERRQMDIITAMTGIGKRHRENNAGSFPLLVFSLFVITCPLLLFFVWLFLKEHLIFLIMAGVFWIAGLLVMIKNKKSAADVKQEELSAMLVEIEEEHELLEKEKEELTIEIKCLREQQTKMLGEEQQGGKK